MKVSKKVSLAMALTLALTATAGCSSGQDSAPTQDTKAVQETKASEAASETKKEPEFKGEKVLVWTNNRHDAEYMEERVKQFNEAYQGQIEVEYVVTTENYINMITMAISSNQAPDIFCVGAATGGFDLNSFATSNLIQPIDPYLSDEFKEIYDLEKLSYQGINALDGSIYFVPTAQRSGNRLLYNKEMFDEAGITEIPKTLGEVVEVAKKLTENGGGTKYGIAMPGLSAAFKRFLYPAAEVSGIHPYDYVNGTYDFTGYKPIIEAARQMFADGSMIPGAASLKIDPLRVQFAEGNIGMMGNASQEVGVLTDQFPAKIEWGVAEIPSLDGTVKGSLSALPQSGWAMTSTAKNPEAAVKVIEYLSSVETMKGYVENGYALSTSEKVMEVVDESKLGKLQEFAPLSYESVYPQFPNVTPSGKNWEIALWEACFPESGDLDAILEELTRDYNEALDKEVKMGKIKRLVIRDFDPLKPTEGTFEYLEQ